MSIVYVELSYTSYIIINIRAMAVGISGSMIIPYPGLVTSFILTFSRKFFLASKKTLFRPFIFRVSFLWWLIVSSRRSSEFCFLHNCSSAMFNLWAPVLTSYLSILLALLHQVLWYQTMLRNPFEGRLYSCVKKNTRWNTIRSAQDE